MDAYEIKRDEMLAALEHNSKVSEVEPEEEVDWWYEFKYLEAQHMQLLDQYTELAVAAGFEPVGYWGDVIEPHYVIVDHIETLKAKAEYDRES
jgi:hypothetical protein